MKKVEDSIDTLLKHTAEQQTVVGPLVRMLISLGWELGQMIFGKKEWRIPKSPSEATKREKGRSFSGFPVDIAVFDSVENCGDPSHVLFIVECKRHEERAGVSQLEAYFVGEPHAQLGIWANSADESSQGVFLYRGTEGRAILKRSNLRSLPIPGEAIAPDSQVLNYTDLIEPSEQIFRKVVSPS